jgi:hypothetical protein
MKLKPSHAHNSSISQRMTLETPVKHQEAWGGISNWCTERQTAILCR